MPTFHVHVYETSSMWELNIDAQTSEEARAIALDTISNDDNRAAGSTPHMQFISLTFLEENPEIEKV